MQSFTIFVLISRICIIKRFGRSIKILPLDTNSRHPCRCICVEAVGAINNGVSMAYAQFIRYITFNWACDKIYTANVYRWRWWQSSPLSYMRPKPMRYQRNECAVRYETARSNNNNKKSLQVTELYAKMIKYNIQALLLLKDKVYRYETCANISQNFFIFMLVINIPDYWKSYKKRECM